MPIYEYRCPSCGTDFELTRPISQSSDPAPCPKKVFCEPEDVFDPATEPTNVFCVPVVLDCPA